MRMHRVILSSVTCPALPYLSTFSHKRQEFRKKMNTKCVFLLSPKILSETILILRIIQQGIIINVLGSSCKVTVTLVRFSGNLDFLDRFSKNTEISNFRLKNTFSEGQVVPCERTDGQTYRHDKVKVAFRNFAKVPKTMHSDKVSFRFLQ
jgi:hypothetical protein